MKKILKVLVILLAVGSLVQAVALAKGKIGDGSGAIKGRSTGPGI